MARIYNLACLVIIAIFSIVTAQDYCNLQSCKQKRANHTMCEYSVSNNSDIYINSNIALLSISEVLYFKNVSKQVHSLYYLILEFWTFKIKIMKKLCF